MAYDNANEVKGSVVNDEQSAWFESEGLIRYSISGDESGDLVETRRGPVVALGPRDDEFVWAPNPNDTAYPGKPLREMSMDDYNDFMYRWYEEAVRHGVVRCANCGRPIRDDTVEDLPDVDTWDAIFIEKELVAWMVVHFDCKKLLPKKIKGVHPFDLLPADPPAYDLSRVSVPIREPNENHNSASPMTLENEEE